MALMDSISAPLAKWSLGNRGNSIASHNIDQSPEEVSRFWNDARNRSGGWWRIIPSTPDGSGRSNSAAQYEWVPGEPPPGYTNPFGGGGGATSEGFKIAPVPDGTATYHMNPSDLSPLASQAGSRGAFGGIDIQTLLEAFRAMGIDPSAGGNFSQGSPGIRQRPIFR